MSKYRITTFLSTATIVILCVLFMWGIGQGQEQEQAQAITCRVLSSKEARAAKQFRKDSVTVKCPNVGYLFVRRVDYRVAEECSTIKLIPTKEGFVAAPEQEGECVIKTPAQIETGILAARQHCAIIKRTSGGYDDARRTNSEITCHIPRYNWR